MLRPRPRRRDGSAALGWLAAFAGVALAAYTPAARASSVTLSDTYFGGLNNYNNNPPSTGDVIGEPLFNIVDAVLTRNGNNLTVRIDTNFDPGASGAAGTGYGSLFFGPTLVPGGSGPTGLTGSAPYATDTYQPGRFTYAAVIQGGTANLYQIGTVNGTNPYPANTTVVQSYTTSTGGTITMSNAYGDPVSYPSAGNNYFYFRQGQAVLFTPADNATATASGTFATAPGSVADNALVFTITDFFSTFGDSFSLAWAMTCANDVLLGNVRLPSDLVPPPAVPLPPALPLFGSALVGLGLLGRRRGSLKKPA